ncbi:hypothetical protein ACN38_g10217 [Penicillium nordicum]|uniref:Uncharacterized protein n=1 Tax=Penicillium nordicum TaxID=229535 RepID=A0A0M9WBV4_9EURO|nr:hypothetical protein ACN38_g10217 [Penicillium nordicum]
MTRESATTGVSATTKVSSTTVRSKKTARSGLGSQARTLQSNAANFVTEMDQWVAPACESHISRCAPENNAFHSHGFHRSYGRPCK